jgi:hypothetical protein
MIATAMGKIAMRVCGRGGRCVCRGHQNVPSIIAWLQGGFITPARNEICKLGEIIFDNKNAIKFVGKRQSGNEVKGDLGSMERMRRNRIEKTGRRTHGRLMNSTFGTGSDES